MPMVIYSQHNRWVATTRAFLTKVSLLCAQQPGVMRRAGVSYALLVAVLFAFCTVSSGEQGLLRVEVGSDPRPKTQPEYGWGSHGSGPHCSVAPQSTVTSNTTTIVEKISQ